jgi:WD40 repeat protein
LPLFTLFGHCDLVEAIAISPLGGLFATGSHDGEVVLWETVCGTWVQRFIASPIAATR